MQIKMSQAHAGGNRQTNMDLLRILACVMVIMQHTAVNSYYAFGSGSRWLVCNFFEVLVRPDVPVFFMLSGSLFLNREKPVPASRLLRKNALKLIIIYLVWTFFYAFVGGGAAGVDSLESLHAFLYQALMDRKYHMWFLPSMFSIYVCLPLLYHAVNGEDARQEKTLEYAVVMFLVLNILIQTISSLGVSDSIIMTSIGSIYYFFGGYCGYFLLGAYVGRLDSDRFKTCHVVLAYVAVFLVHFGLSTAHAYHYQIASQFLYDSFSLPVCLETVLLFILFQKMCRVNFPEWLRKVSCEVANCTLGIYVLHVYVLETIGTRTGGLLLQGHHTVISIPVTVAAVFICSLIMVWVLRKIPFVGRWLV